MSDTYEPINRHISGGVVAVAFYEYLLDWITLNGIMPQGCYMDLLICLVLINDLTAGCLLHKFMDDTTVSEIIPKGGCSNVSTILSDVVNWSRNNLTGTKLKKCGLV